MKVEQVFKAFNSPVWVEKEKAREALSFKRDSAGLKEIYDYVEKSANPSYQMIFIDHLESVLITSKSIDSLSYTLVILNRYFSKMGEKVSLRVRHICESFFESKKRFRYEKILSTRNAWQKLDNHEKRLLTHLIGQFGFQELSPLILNNFSSKENEKLILKSIEAMVVLSEKRSLPFLRSALRKSSKEVRLKLLDALSELGGYFDLFVCHRYLSDSDFEIRKAACKLYRNLLGNLSFSFLRNVIEKEETQGRQNQIVRLMGELDSRQAIEFLIERYLESDDHQLKNLIEWAFMQMSAEDVVRVLKKRFYEGDERGQQAILTLLSEVYHSSCFSLFKDVILNDKFSTLTKITALESLSSRDSEESAELLIDCLKSGDELTAYYTVASCLRNSRTDKTEVFKIIDDLNLSKESIIFDVVLTYLYERGEVHAEEEYFQGLILEHLETGNDERKYLAVRAASFFPANDVFQTCIKLLLSQESSENLKGESALSLIKMFSRNNTLLEERYDLLNNSYILKKLKGRKLDISFYEKIVLIVKDHDIKVISEFCNFFKDDLARLSLKFLNSIENLNLARQAIEILLFLKTPISEELRLQIYERYFVHLSEEDKPSFLNFLGQSKKVEVSNLIVRGYLSLDIREAPNNEAYLSYLEGLNE